MRSILAGIVALLAVAVFAPRGWTQDLPLTPPQRAWLEEHPKVTVAVYAPGWPPFEQWNQGRLEGLSPDYLGDALERLGVSATYRVYQAWPDMLRAACEGEVDVLMNVSISAERTECMIFTRQYIQVPMAVVARTDDAQVARSEDLAGLRIVTEHGFVSGQVAADRYPLAVPVQVDTTLQALQAVIDGRADVYIGNAYVATELMRRHGLAGIGLVRVSELSMIPLHFAVPNDNRVLAESLNVAMQAMPQARRDAIELKWLPDLQWIDSGGSIFRPEERKALDRPITVGYPPAAGPISFSDAQGRPSGLVADYLRRFTELGARLEPYPAQTWQQVREAMRRGEVDAAITVVDPLDTGREWVHSQPIIAFPNVIVTRSDARTSVLELSDLSSATIALSDPQRLQPLVSRTAHGARFVAVADAAEGLEQVRARKADAYVGNLAVVDALIGERFAGELRVAAPADIDDSFVLAARAEDASLVTAFDRMLASMSPRERAAIRGDWLAVEYADRIDWRRVLRWLLPLLLVLAAVGGLHARSYRRLRAEVEQRRRIEQRFGEVTQNLPAVVYEVAVSDAGEATFPFIVGDLVPLFGITAEEAMAQPALLLDRIEPSDRVRFREVIQQSMATGAGVDFRFRAMTAGGWRWIHTNSLPYRSDDTHWHWTGYWIDVTEQHRQWLDMQAAKAAAEQAAQAKSDFLATMSHEIRTPMTGVVGLLEVLSHTPLDDEQARIVHTIDDSARVLRQVLDDILDFSKMEAGALTLEAHALDLRALVESVVRMLQSLADDKQLQVTARFDPRLAPRHLGDDVRLRQVLFNLLSNAIKFTDHGRVEVSVSVLDQVDGAQALALAVVDTGIGIAPERQEALFQPFAQAEASISRRYGGTGLGLSICQRIVSLMGGTIALSSTPGEGTEVVVRIALPVAEDATEVPVAMNGADPPRIAALAEGATIRVLVAEDHPTNRTLMAWYLQQLGLPYDMVDDGAQALRAWEQGGYDLLITDGLMPVMDGYTLAREIRRQETERGLPRMPIVAVTASVITGELELCKAAGIDGYLAKPVSLHALARTLNQWLPVKVPARPAPTAPESGPAPPDVFEQDILPAMIRMYGSLRVAIEMLRGFCQTTRTDVDQLVASEDDRLAQGELMHRLSGGLHAIMQPGLAGQAKELERRLVETAEPVQEDVRAFGTRLQSLVWMLEERLAATSQ